MAQARDEAQGTCLQQKEMVAEAQARGSQLALQVEALRRRLEELQQVTGTSGAWGGGGEGDPAPGPPPPPSHRRAWQELSNKDQEKVAEVTRVRVELQEQNGRLQAELTAQETLKEKVAALERQLRGEPRPAPTRPRGTGSGGARVGAGPGRGVGSERRPWDLGPHAASLWPSGWLMSGHWAAPPRSDGEWPPRGAAGPRERERLPPREAAAAGGGDRAHPGGGGPEGQLPAERGPGLRAGVPRAGPELPEVRGGQRDPGSGRKVASGRAGRGVQRVRRNRCPAGLRPGSSPERGAAEAANRPEWPAPLPCPAGPRRRAGDGRKWGQSPPSLPPGARIPSRCDREGRARLLTQGPFEIKNFSTL